MNPFCSSILLLAFASLLLSCKGEVLDELIIQGLKVPNEIVAGEDIVLEAKLAGETPWLQISNVIGSTLIEGTQKDQHYEFLIPDLYTQISGELKWRLKDEHGTINILAHKEIASIESYIGPTTVRTEAEQAYMSVALIKDKFGNASADGLPVMLKTQYKGQIETEKLQVSDGIVYKMGSERNQVGKITLSFQSAAARTKEYQVDVGPGNANDFVLRADREHNKADGNSLVRLSTNVIKDRYNNIVANGTIVQFTIQGKEKKSTVNAFTIEGVARTEVTHPSSSDNWMVSAQIAHLAESNSFNLKFEPALTKMSVDIDEDKRLRIGPLTSYLDQYIPDGFPVKFRITQSNKIIQDWIHLESGGGYAKYDIKPILSTIDEFHEDLSIEIRAGDLSNQIVYKMQ